MRILILLLLTVAFSLKATGQGIIRGKVTGSNGETLIGATIVLKSNMGYGTTADFDGNYSLKINDSTPQTLIVSYISYNTQEIKVTLKKNEVQIRNIILESASQSVSQVEITGKAVRSNNFYVENMQKKSATTIDYVSAETMKKTGDANITAAVTRVAGVSTNGSFITVRGIGDRYVKTSINGSRIPTLDPFTNNIKLDLFPASLVDNVLITKTSSAELPGDWAGAYLSVETKDYPEELTVNVEATIGYNTQSTFKEVISAARSKTDWLGYDNSLRDYNHGQFVNAIINPSNYQEFVALGLKDYFNSIGVTEANWYKNATEYFKLGLVQLGLLAPAQFNDVAAVQNATNLYNIGNYKSEAFQIINANVYPSVKKLPTNWNTGTRTAPLNFSQSFSIGNQFNLFNKPVGFLAGFRYNTSNQYDPEATANRASVAADTSGQLINSISSALKQQSSVEVNGWSALFNIAYKLNNNNSLSLLFMPNFTGSNRVRKSFDKDDVVTVVTMSQFYEQRKQLVYQLKSENYIPYLKTKIETNASYTSGKSSTPDFKNVQYWINPDGTYQIGGAIGDGIHRYYRYLDENIADLRTAIELPISKNSDLIRKIKFGGSVQYTEQNFDQYDYFVLQGPEIGTFENGDVDAYLNQDQFNITSGINDENIPYSSFNAYYQELGNAANHTFGNSYTFASFLMSDFAITRKFRIAGGLRMEWAHVFTDVVKFDSLGLAKDDPRRVYSTSYPIANPGELNNTVLLPSINLIYKIKDNEDNPINLRVNYSQSVARPSIRELSDVATVDYELRSGVFGNSQLKPVTINNYDFRVESFFKSGNTLSTSLFYKTFKNHIELVNTNGYTWQNANESTVAGIEIEGRVKINSKIELGSNLTFVKSKTNLVRTRYELSGGYPVNIPLDTISRSMFGQAPYAINFIANYKLDSLGLVCTISYNIQGPRLVLASNNKEIPDVYELPRNLIDLKVSKTIGEHFSVSVAVKDLLNTSVRRSYKYDSGGYDVLDYDKVTYGTTYNLSIAYKLK